MSRRAATVVYACALAAALAACGEGAPDGGPRPADPGAGVGDSVMAGGNGETPPSAEEGTASGQAVYTANCAACHGDTGAGNGPASIGLEPPPSDMTDGEWTTGDGSIGAIRNTIVNGSPGTAMIAWQGTLTEGEISAVADYVQSLGGGNP